jgi:hypothetical protein
LVVEQLLTLPPAPNPENEFAAKTLLLPEDIQGAFATK